MKIKKYFFVLMLLAASFAQAKQLHLYPLITTPDDSTWFVVVEDSSGIKVTRNVLLSTIIGVAQDSVLEGDYDVHFIQDTLRIYSTNEVLHPGLILEAGHDNIAGGSLIFKKSSSTPADNDQIGYIIAQAKDDGGSLEAFTWRWQYSDDVTDNNEAGRVVEMVSIGGNLKEFISMDGYNGTVGQGSIDLNRELEDVDVTVKGDTSEYNFHSDAVLGAVGIGTADVDSNLTVSRGVNVRRGLLVGADLKFIGDIYSNTLRLNYSGSDSLDGGILKSGTVPDIALVTNFHNYADSITHDGRRVPGDSIMTEAEIIAAYQPLDTTLTRLAGAEIKENFDNTLFPWADNEVADDVDANAITIRNIAISQIAPQNGYIPKYNSSQDSVLWVPDAGGSGSNYADSLLHDGRHVPGDSIMTEAEIIAAFEPIISTALAVTKGGTGAQTLTDGGILLGSGTSAITAMSVLSDGSIVIGDGTTDPTTIQAFTAYNGTGRHEVGMLEADISAYSGLIAVSGGSTSEIDDSSELAGQITDEEGHGYFVLNGSPHLADTLSIGTNAVASALMYLIASDNDTTVIKVDTYDRVVIDQATNGLLVNGGKIVTTKDLNTGGSGVSNGQLNFDAIDGDQGYQAITPSDQLQFIGFSGGQLFDNDVFISASKHLWFGANQIDDGNNLVNGAMLSDDSVTDDKLDLNDITGADFDLTDCGAISATTISGTTINGTTITASTAFIAGDEDIFGLATDKGHFYIDDLATDNFVIKHADLQLGTSGSLDGTMTWIDQSGGTGEMTISSDQMKFNNFSGGVYVGGPFTCTGNFVLAYDSNLKFNFGRYAAGVPNAYMDANAPSGNAGFIFRTTVSGSGEQQKMALTYDGKLQLNTGGEHWIGSVQWNKDGTDYINPAAITWSGYTGEISTTNDVVGDTAHFDVYAGGYLEADSLSLGGILIRYYDGYINIPTNNMVMGSGNLTLTDGNLNVKNGKLHFGSTSPDSALALVGGARMDHLRITEHIQADSIYVANMKVNGRLWADEIGFHHNSIATHIDIDNTNHLIVADNGTFKAEDHIIVGSAAVPTANGNHCLVFDDNGATNPTYASGTAGLFAKSVSSVLEVFAIDDDSNVTQISPHDPVTGEWIFYSTNTRTGRSVRVNMEQMIRKLEKYTGEKFLHEFYE